MLEILIDKSVGNIDRNINLASITVGVFGVLITVLVIGFSFRNEGVAKNVASTEIENWLKNNAESKLDNISNKYAKDFDKHLSKAKVKLDEIADGYAKGFDNNLLDVKRIIKEIKEKEKEANDLFSRLDKNISPYNIKLLKQKSNNAKRIIEDKRTIEEWEELFLSAYYEKDYDKAIEYSKKIIEINPKNDDAYSNMGNTYDEIEQYDKAIESYKSAIEINPKKDEAYYNMGNAYRKIEQYDKAIESYNIMSPQKQTN